MKTRFLTIGLAAMLAAGCKTSSKELNKVHLGMPEAEVVKILGEPESKAESKDGSKTLYYSLAELGVGNVPYSVKLVNGKVDSYGRDGATTSPQTVPIITPMPAVR
jgi:hypothetical protein